MTDQDAGVPYLSDVSFTGPQYEFSVNAAYETNEYPGFGASKSDYEDMVVAGNTFDYPYLHGQSIKVQDTPLFQQACNPFWLTHSTLINSKF